jgi:hypothetical protein
MTDPFSWIALPSLGLFIRPASAPALQVQITALPRSVRQGPMLTQVPFVSLPRIQIKIIKIGLIEVITISLRLLLLLVKF